MTTPTDHGASYVPALIIRRVAANAEPTSEAITENLETALLFADISGFTALTERLAERGEVGMEELSQVISDYFGCLTEVIADHGGDIVKFAGDALLALWPASAVEPLPIATQRAAQCALAIQMALQDFALHASATLELKVALGAGSAICMHVGGVFNRWELLAAGSPFLQAGRAGHHAKPGDVVISAEALALLDPTGVGVSGVFDDGTACLISLASEVPLSPLTLPALTPEIAQRLLPYVPAAIRAQLGAGKGGWFAELRRITVLFVNLPGITHTTPIEQAQQMMIELQKTLYQFEGSVNKLSVDDKGVTFIGVMGLPPLSHKDDPARGLQAALALQACLKKLDLKTAIGITTGRAYCGSMGSRRRCEYTIMGDVVNLSARLMQAAPDSILCDAPTHDAAPDGFVFEKLEPIMVKGKAAPIQTYRPLEQSLTVAVKRRSAQAIVGRRKELDALLSRLQALTDDKQNAVVIVEGEPGIGKSRLMEELEDKAKAMHIRTVVGAADAIDRANSYHAWRPLFSTLLGLDTLKEPQARRDHVLQLLSARPELFQLAPLLNVIVPLDLSENEITVQMTGELRADNTQDLLLGILRLTVGAIPLLVIIEDAHWKDSASWALTRRVVRDMHPLMLVLATRPISESVPLEYDYLLGLSITTRLVLDALEPEEAIALACRRLGIEALPAPIARMIRDRAGGNPFFTEEMAYALREEGYLIIDKGQCEVAPGVDIDSISMPNTVEGVISERIDRLHPDQQMSLKIASVLGRTFPERLLCSIHPVETDVSRVIGHLDAFQAAYLALLETHLPERVFIFKHLITQQVAYNLMLFSQRRDLHRAVAAWHEAEHAANLAPYYPMLAHHYSKAEDNTKAIHYLELAGIHAVTNFANEEAIGFLHQAMAIDEKAPDLSDAARRANWQAQLGEAYYALGRHAESREHLNRALTLLGYPPPGSNWKHTTSLLAGALRQTARRLFSNRLRRADESRYKSVLKAATANERLCQIYYMENAKVQSMNAAVTALNLAETCGTSPELARSYSNVTVTTALLRAYRLSSMYERLALDTATATGHLPSLAFAHEVAGLYHLGAGHWQDAETRFNASLTLAETIGDRRRWDEAKFLSGILFHRHGCFIQAKQCYEELYAAGRRRGILQVQLWGLTGRLALSLPLGGDAEVVALLEGLLVENGKLENGIARADAILAYGTLAPAYLRAGHTDRARDAVERVVRLIEESETVSYYLLSGYHGLGEAVTTLFARQRRTGDVSQERRMIKKILSTFNSFAMMYPTARPMALIWAGVYARIDGREAKARRCFAKTQTLAEHLDMPFALAIAHRELARLDLEDTPARHAHTEQARRLFLACGAVQDAENLATSVIREP